MPTRNQSGGRLATRTLLGAALLTLTSSSAIAQEAERPVTPDRPTMSDFGKDLSDSEAGALLAEMRDLLGQAISASQAAQAAGSVAEV